MKRRSFIKTGLTAAWILSGHEWVKASILTNEASTSKKRGLRFAVASDGHYGEPNTTSAENFANLVQHVNEEHGRRKFDFCMINGDIVHNEKEFYTPAKAALDKLAMPYYVSQGNHDRVTPDEWQSIWNMPVNHDFRIRKNGFLVGTTSDVKGEYHCPDLDWMRSALEKHKEQEHVFIFLHINPVKQTKGAVDCPELTNLLKQYRNVKAVFDGHDHDQDDVKVKDGIPFIFDGHFGGSWGVSYKGYRVVETMEDGRLVTYMMNPTVKLDSYDLGYKM